MQQLIPMIESNLNNFSVLAGEQTNQLLDRLTKLDKDEKDTLLTEAADILSHCVKPNTTGSETGIAIGYVQSGKTMSFTTLTTLAYDNGFRIVIYLAGVKTNLLSQTNNRLKTDLLTSSDNSQFYKVYDNPKIEQDAVKDISRALMSISE